MRLINHITPDLWLTNNVAIVGSSGAPQLENHGPLIDSYTDVIRFNRAPVEGYEDIVGAKTTLRVVNSHVFANIDAEIDGFTNQPQYFVRDLRNTKMLYISPTEQEWKEGSYDCHESNTVYLYDHNHSGFLKQKYNYETEKHMSVGFTTILLCVECGIVPHLFGFDTMNTDMSHYWEDRPNAGPCHDITVERQIISKLARHDKVKVFK